MIVGWRIHGGASVARGSPPKPCGSSEYLILVVWAGQKEMEGRRLEFAPSRRGLGKPSATRVVALPGVLTDLGFSYSARGEVTDAYQSTPHSNGYYHTTASYWANGLVNTLGGPGLPTFTYTPGRRRPRDHGQRLERAESRDRHEL
jgi:hypothetical protein